MFRVLKSKYAQEFHKGGIKPFEFLQAIMIGEQQEVLKELKKNNELLEKLVILMTPEEKLPIEVEVKKTTSKKV